MTYNYQTSTAPLANSITAHSNKTNEMFYGNKTKAKRTSKASSAIAFLLKNKTYSLFGIILLGFFTPVVTNMAGARDNHPALQDLVKVVSYTGAFAASLYGAVSESDKKLMLQRIREDAKTNTDFAVEKIVLRQEGITRLDNAFSIADGQGVEMMIGNSPYTWNQGSLPPSRENGSGYQVMALPPAPENTTNNTPSAAPVISEPLKGNFTAPSQTGGATVKDSKEAAKEAVIKSYQYLTDMKDKQYISYLVFGRQGDNKSTMLQYTQYQMLKRDPGAVFMVHDRKFYASGKEDPKFRSVWSGIPIYEKSSSLVSVKFPFSHILAQDVPDFSSWLKPIESLYDYRNSSQPIEGDPLYDPINKRVRPVILVLEDATTTLSDYKAMNKADKSKYDATVMLLGRIGTLMRSSGIFLWFVTHDCTTEATDIPQYVMEQLHPIVGSSFANNRKQLSLVKETPVEEGLQLAARSASYKVKGFATAWTKAPYIAPAPIKSTMDMVDANIVLDSHYGAPDGFQVMPYHRAALKRIGMKETDLGKLNTADIKVEEIDDVDDIPVMPTEKVIINEGEYPSWTAEASGSEELEKAEVTAKIIEMRNWYREHGDNHPSPESVVDQIASQFSISLDEAATKLTQVMSLVQCNESRFGKEMLNDPSYKDPEL